MITLVDALTTVLIVQYAAPLALTIPIAVRKRGPFATERRRADRAEAGQEPAEGEGRALAPLVCPSCSAPVALAGQAFECPHCRAVVQPPEEYVRALALRARAADELARAERRWRWSRWSSSRLVTWPMRAAFVAWLLAILAAMVFVETSTPIKMIALALAVIELFVGWALASTFDAARTLLPAVPRAGELHAPAGTGECRTCGAPVAFAQDALAAICGYCGGDNYREALAKASDAHARHQERLARGSLLAATRELAGRRDEVLGFVVMMAIAVVFYGAFLAVGTICQC